MQRILLCLFAFVLPSAEAEELTGIHLLQHCTTAVKEFDGGQNMTPNELIRSTACTAYVAGWRAAADYAATTHHGFACFDANVDNSQLVRVLEKFLHDSPAILNQRADTLIALALIPSFSCK
jgi:hypothetical protein